MDFLWTALILGGAAAFLWDGIYEHRVRVRLRALKAPPGLDQYRHLKSGGIYTVLHDDATREHDLEPTVVYRNNATGRVWTRSAEEFFDGRFEAVAGDGA